MSQEELASKLGYKSRSTIAKIEAGLNDIPQSKIVAFAKALGVEPGYLMGWEEDEVPQPTDSSDSYSDEEDNLIRRFRNLSPEAQSRISDQIDFELFRQEKASEKEEQNLG